jgi:uncharacterized protein YeaO (DUF488 family)
MISTTNYNSAKMKQALSEGRPIYGISRWPYRWMKQELITGYSLILAPSEALLDSFDTWENFTADYIAELTMNPQTVCDELQRLDKLNAVVCCFEKDCSNCHRSLLKYFSDLNELEIDIAEM